MGGLKLNTIKNLQSIIEEMFHEGEESRILEDGKLLLVYGNGTYELV